MSNVLDSSSDEEEENRRRSSVQTKKSLLSIRPQPLCLIPLLQQHLPDSVHRQHHKLGSSL